jgi:DNA modification methylase
MVLLNRIACMDCLEYLQQLPDNSVDLVVTDPPYNVSQKQNMSWMGREVRKDFGDWDYGFDPTPVLIELKRVLKPTGQIFRIRKDAPAGIRTRVAAFLQCTERCSQHSAPRKGGMIGRTTPQGRG